MEEYTIPKDYSQDDRIGSYTIPQAIVLGGGVLLAMFLMITGLPMWITIPLAIIILIITVILMFYKINAIPMYEFIPVYLTYMATPKLLIFKADNIRDEYIDEIDFFLLEDVETDVIDITSLQSDISPKKKKKKVKDGGDKK